MSFHSYIHVAKLFTTRLPMTDLPMDQKALSRCLSRQSYRQSSQIISSHLLTGSAIGCKTRKRTDERTNDMNGLAPPLTQDPTDERRGSWTGDFDPSRRTSFANSFLETPPSFVKLPTRPLQGRMHHVPLDEEPDLMSTPPISPVATRHSRAPSSYFDSPTQKKVVRSAQAKEAEENSLFSTLLNKAFETVSKSGEAMDVHGKDVVDLSEARRAAKGKGRAIAYDADDESLPSSPIRLSRPTGARATTDTTAEISSAPVPGTAPATRTSEDEFYASHPFEAGLVNTLEAAEKKVSEWWAWLSPESSQAPLPAPVGGTQRRAKK